MGVEENNMRAKTPKFTKKERAKLALVFNELRARLAANLSPNGYNNDLGCGNCGDTGPFHGTLFELELLTGMRKLGGKS
jgi:hypothetical protein